MLMPVILRFGERPAGAVIGARGDDMLARRGVKRREGMVEGGGIAFGGVVKLKLNVFVGLSKESLLVFFDGESKTFGSTFSESKSSSKDLFTGEFTLLVEIMVGLLLTAEGFCAKRPDKVSYVT